MKTAAVFVTPYRRRARKLERVIQAWLDAGRPYPGLPLDYPQIPEWAQGVRAERVGVFSWIVTATEYRGH